MFRLLPVLFLMAGLVCRAADTVVILPLFNASEAKAPNLDWIGESVAETIHESLSSAGLLVLAREEREEGYRRLSLRPSVVLTKASVIKIGETLDAGRVIFGEFKVEGSDAGAASLKSNMRLTIHMIDLKKLREGPVLEQAGPLETLSHMEMELAWLLLKELAPASAPVEGDFLRLHPAVRVDAMESYVRGLMAVTPEQKIKLFTQSARLDDRFSQPTFQLGRIFFVKKDYKTATTWLTKVTRADSHFMEASFLLGLCHYYNGNFDGAIQQFRMVAAEVPLNEVFNNLGAALSRRNDPSAVDNFKKAIDGDAADPDYWFNLGYEFWKQSQFTQAAEAFRAVLDRASNDQEATTMLGRSIKMDAPRAGDPKTEGRQRIKTTFEDSAFRQLKAELQAK
ncbi:MAG: tetratricopeptide repeat protein [Terriglobia bacterium]